LFTDIERLEWGDYFTPGEWEDGWFSLIGASDVEDVSKGAQRFGQKIGLMLRQLALYPHSTDREELWADLISGFMYGLCFEEESQHPETRRETLDSLLGKVEQRVESKCSNREADEQEYFEQRMMKDTNRKQSESRITEILENESIEPAEDVAVDVLTILDDGYGEISPEEITRDQVIEVVENRDLAERRKLISKVREDITQLRTIEHGGISALELIEALDAPVKAVSSREVNHEFEGRDALNNIEALGAFLLGEKKIDGTTWEGVQIVELDNPGAQYGESEWKLTDYGSALRSVHIQGSHSVTTLDGGRTTESNIRRALNRLRIEDEL
jgi:hypothetical protein